MAYKPPPGPKTPQKYKRPVGPKYSAFGEQEDKGYYYDPLTDSYSRDPDIASKTEARLEQENNPPKPPGLTESLLPVAGTAAAIGVGTSLGKDGGAGLLTGLGDTISRVKDTVGNFFGGGGSASQAVVNQASGAVPEYFGPGGAPGALAPGYDAATELATTSTPGAALPEAGMFDLGGIGAEGNVLLPAVGAVGAYDVLTHNVSAGRGALEGAASGAAIGSYFGPPGAVVGGIAGGTIGLAKSFFDNPSVRERVTKRWDSLSQSSDPAVASYAKQYREYLDSDQAKIDAQSGNTFDDKKKAGTLTGKDVWGGESIIKNIPGWLTDYSEDQRLRISQAYVDADILESDHGDIKIKDLAKAKKIAEDIKNGVSSNAPDTTNKGLLVTPTPINVGNAKGVQMTSGPDPSSSGLMVNPKTGTARPWGYDEDPNHPGQYIRRS